MRLVALAVLLATTAGTAHADDPDDAWYHGRYGRNRVLHVALTASLGTLAVATSPFEASWAADTCVWCKPTGVDVAVRDALVWHDTSIPNTLSNITAYGLTPTSAIVAILLETPPTTADAIDNVLPITESVTTALLVTRIVKLAIARQRPYAHFGIGGTGDANLSFPSGHSSASFSVAVSSGMVAHMRGYSHERFVWIAGLTFATATAYFRIAADKHYLTDVATGASIGAGIGLTMPLLMKRDVAVTADTHSVALVGQW
jgi:membrane-associated phospholipid phosphatase